MFFLFISPPNKSLSDLLIFNYNLPWKLELACVCPFGAKSCEDFAIDVKDLYAMIVRVTDDNSVGITHSDIVGMLKITRFATHDSKLANKWAIGLENLEN